MSNTVHKLSFGYHNYPEGTKAVWGARLIIDQQGWVDLVPDRQDAFPDPEWRSELKPWLDSGALRSALDNLGDLLKGYKLSTRETREVVLYEDDQGKIVGNPNSSAGYCYIAGWLHKDAKTAEERLNDRLEATANALLDMRTGEQ